jgi:hypothetical protein
LVQELLVGERGEERQKTGEERLEQVRVGVVRVAGD